MSRRNRDKSATLSTSPNFSAEIVRTANDQNRVYKIKPGFCGFARLFTKKFPGKLKIQQKDRLKTPKQYAKI